MLGYWENAKLEVCLIYPSIYHNIPTKEEKFHSGSRCKLKILIFVLMATVLRTKFELSNKNGRSMIMHNI
jgi:hypothetical protein